MVWVVNATPPAALPLGKGPGAHCMAGWAGPQGRPGRVRKISPPPPPGFDPRTVQSAANLYTDYAIPAPTFLQWLYIKYLLSLTLLKYLLGTSRYVLIMAEGWWSASRSGRFTSGNTWYPLYRRLEQYLGTHANRLLLHVRMLMKQNLNSHRTKSSLFWVVTQRMVVSYRRFGTTYRSQLEGSSCPRRKA